MTKNYLEEKFLPIITVGNDSLFLGLKFGITMDEFFEQCRKLNKQGLVQEGSKNMSVE